MRADIKAKIAEKSITEAMIDAAELAGDNGEDVPALDCGWLLDMS